MIKTAANSTFGRRAAAALACNLSEVVVESYAGRRGRKPWTGQPPLVMVYKKDEGTVEGRGRSLREAVANLEAVVAENAAKVAAFDRAGLDVDSVAIAEITVQPVGLAAGYHEVEILEVDRRAARANVAIRETGECFWVSMDKVKTILRATIEIPVERIERELRYLAEWLVRDGGGDDDGAAVEFFVNAWKQNPDAAARWKAIRAREEARLEAKKGGSK